MAHLVINDMVAGFSMVITENDIFVHDFCFDLAELASTFTSTDFCVCYSDRLVIERIADWLLVRFCLIHNGPFFILILSSMTSQAMFY